ncbi:MAG: hypothetical protein AB7W16_16825 [Candidatus Obscuribacterales bacterium]
MKSNLTSSNKTSLKTAVGLALALGLASSSFYMEASAQGLDAKAGLLGETVGLSPDQDTLLPPVVVPFDHNQARKLYAPEASSKVISAEVEDDVVPALAPDQEHMNMSPASGIQSARDLRQSAINSLMTGGNLAALNPQAGADPGQIAQSFNPLVDPSQTAQLTGQPDWLAPQDAGAAMQHPGYIGNVGQTQTLTAGSKVPIVRRDIRRGGLGNAIAGFTSLGAGMLSGSNLRRPNSLMGLGIMGLTSTGFGVRNGFHF